MSSMFEDALKQAIEERAVELKEALVKAAVGEFERQLRAAVGTVAVNAAKYYSVTIDGPELLIRVQIEEKKT